jgi:hypothetical protein
MGHLLGHDVRLGPTTPSASDAMAAGEGIETMLSLRCIETTPPMVAALPAAHLDADLETLLWSTVNSFHRSAAQIQRTIDANEEAQKRMQKE